MHNIRYFPLHLHTFRQFWTGKMGVKSLPTFSAGPGVSSWSDGGWLLICFGLLGVGVSLVPKEQIMRNFGNSKSGWKFQKISYMHICSTISSCDIRHVVYIMKCQAKKHVSANCARVCQTTSEKLLRSMKLLWVWCYVAFSSCSLVLLSSHHFHSPWHRPQKSKADLA